MSFCSTSRLRLNLVLTHGITPDVHGGVHLFLPAHTVGSVPSLSGHAIAYRWRSLPRVRWHRASIVLTVVQVTGAVFASPWNNYYCAPLFSNTRYWYKVSMLKYKILVLLLLYCFMDTFCPSDLCLYKYKESSSHSTKSPVVCPNIISSVLLLLYCGPVFPRLMCVQV